MVEFDFVSIIIPSAIAGIISFVLLGVKKLGQTSEGTLSGTIKLEHVTAGLEDLETRLNKQFDKMESLISQREAESKQSLNKIWDRLEELNANQKLSTYRLDKLERNSSNAGRGAV